MSRKTLMAVIAVITAVLAFLKDQFGLAIDTAAVVGGLGAVVLYILFEAKLDLKKIGAQANRWADPKFWLAFVAALYAVLQGELGLKLPLSPEVVSSILAAIMSLLFAKRFKEIGAA